MSVWIKPALLKRPSEGKGVAGMQNKALAMFVIFGYFLWFNLKKYRGPSSSISSSFCSLNINSCLLNWSISVSIGLFEAFLFCALLSTNWFSILFFLFLLWLFGVLFVFVFSSVQNLFADYYIWYLVFLDSVGVFSWIHLFWRWLFIVFILIIRDDKRFYN